MFEVRKTAQFESWLTGLRDQDAVRRIVVRIARVEAGLIGDVKYFDGIGELRVDYGPGYRVYFVKRGKTIIVLLCGGDKSGQKSDIKQAIKMAQEV